MRYVAWRDLTLLLMRGQRTRFSFGMYKSGSDRVQELMQLINIFYRNGLGLSLYHEVLE